MKEVSNDDSSEEESAKPVKNTKLKEEVKNVVDNISPATMIETVTLIEDLRDLFKDRPEDYNALMELVRRMNPEGIEYANKRAINIYNRTTYFWISNLISFFSQSLVSLSEDLRNFRQYENGA